MKKIITFPFIKTTLCIICITVFCVIPKIEFETISLAGNDHITTSKVNSFSQGVETAALMHANAWKSSSSIQETRIIDFPLMRKDPLKSPVWLSILFLFIAIVTWEKIMWKSKKDMKKSNAQYWF